MGVTIHFEGHVLDESALQLAIAKARALGQAFGWRATVIAEAHVELVRVVDEEEIPYTGRTRGVELRPHEECDPIRLEFGDDLFVQDYVKTQFAGAETHVQVVELLREIQPCFRDLEVFDEGEFWESYDHNVLRKHIEDTHAAIKDYVDQNPGARIKVRLPSGKIADLIS